MWPETGHLRHWLHFLQLRTTIKTLTLGPFNKEWWGQHSQLLQCFYECIPKFNFPARSSQHQGHLCWGIFFAFLETKNFRGQRSRSADLKPTWWNPHSAEGKTYSVLTKTKTKTREIPKGNSRDDGQDRELVEVHIKKKNIKKLVWWWYCPMVNNPWVMTL